MRFRYHLVIIPALATLAACGGSGGTTAPNTRKPSTPSTPSTPSSPTTPAEPTQASAVVVTDNTFSPANIQVAPGTTVTWSWGSGVSTHNVTFADGVSSGDKGSNATYSRTFTNAGTFNYQCTLHGGMTGSVLVK